MMAGVNVVRFGSVSHDDDRYIARNDASDALSQIIQDTNSSANDAVQTAAHAALDSTIAGKVDKGELVVNAADHGAVGDDSTDNSTPLMDALNALSAAGGGKLYIPPGTYRINNDVTISHPNVEIAGHGSMTFLKLRSSTLYIEGSGSPMESFVMRDLLIKQYNSAEVQDAVSINKPGGGSPYANRMYMENVRIEHATGAALSISNAFVLNLVGCYLRSAETGLLVTSHGGAYTTTANAVNMYGGEINQCTTAVSIESGHSVNFFGTVIEGNTNGAKFAATRGASMYSAYFEGNTNYDVRLEGDADYSPPSIYGRTCGFTASGCAFLGTTPQRDAFQLVRASGVSIHGNSFGGYGTEPIQVNEAATGEVNGVEFANVLVGGNAPAVVDAHGATGFRSL